MMVSLVQMGLHQTMALHHTMALVQAMALALVVVAAAATALTTVVAETAWAAAMALVAMTVVESRGRRIWEANLVRLLCLRDLSTAGHCPMVGRRQRGYSR